MEELSSAAPPHSALGRFAQKFLAALLTLGSLAYSIGLTRRAGLVLFPEQFLAAAKLAIHMMLRGGYASEYDAHVGRKLANIPIYIVIGDHAQDRVDASRRFQKEMAAIGGHVDVDVLPEAGIYGNGHTMMLEKNNKQIMFRMIAWLEGNVFKPK